MWKRFCVSLGLLSLTCENERNLIEKLPQGKYSGFFHVEIEKVADKPSKAFEMFFYCRENVIKNFSCFPTDANQALADFDRVNC